MQDVARQYLEAGLCVLPARRAQKRPAVGAWKQYQQRLPTEAELEAWFANGHDALCLICGEVSGNLELLDFDGGGELFRAWWAEIPEALRERLVVERSPSGGYHVIYRCELPVCGNLKLAQCQRPGGAIETLIETRGEGGLFLCDPTAGYAVEQGDVANPPTLSEEERSELLMAAHGLNAYMSEPLDGQPSAPRGHVSPPAGAGGSVDRPGDDFNARGDVRDVLEKHGWVRIREGENEYWRRPGKQGTSNSATFNGTWLYVFSTNASPFEPNQPYTRFAVYTMLEHGGDFEAAAGRLAERGFGSFSACYQPDLGVDISGYVGDTPAPRVEDDDRPPEVADPGPMPVEMLRIPGFVSEVMDHTLATAPYPSTEMAFAGALALQAVLAGRKVRDPADNRTNVYLLALAYSSAGKDAPRKVNKQILRRAGLANCIAEQSASGEGIEDALHATPSMLFMPDEVDTLLQSINNARDARYEATMRMLLTMFSSSNTIYPMRRRAGQTEPGVIEQPNMVLLGTAIPNHYYAALSERMLTNGLFARMIILDTGKRSPGQEPSIRPIPDRVMQTACWWAEYQPAGNLGGEWPEPAVVEQTPEARQLLVEGRLEAEAEYSKAEDARDAVGTTVWGRVSEHTRKLALLYAISESHESPQIGRNAVEWATGLVMHQTRRMLFNAREHVSQNPFDAECLKAIRKLRAAPDGQLTHTNLFNRMRLKSKEFREVIDALYERGDIEPVDIPTAGRTGRAYRLVRL